MKPITIYWAPSSFNIEEESWNMAYTDPTPVIQTLTQQVSNNDFLTCPGFRDSVKNLYSFNSALEEYTQLNPTELQFLHDNEDIIGPMSTNLKIVLTRQRKNSIHNHINAHYNMSWVLFADEPLTVKFTAPYLPPTAPAEGATLVTGQFDIGQWFRSFNLEYLLPTTTTEFIINKNEPLYYIQPLTDRKIIFKRFNRNNKLKALELEFVQSAKRYGFGYTLAQRYNMFKQSRMRNMILDEIKNNLV